MKAIIPAAGIGTRLRPHTYTQPKVLLNVAGKPIIAHILDQIKPTRIDHIVFIVGYLKEIFEEWVREHYPDLNLEFVQQTEYLGLGHAVGMGLSENDGEVIIILGDTIFETDMDDVLASSYSSLGTRVVEDPRRFGVVVEKSGFVTDLIEKPSDPPGNRIIVGLYYIKNGGLLKQCIDGIIQDNVTVKGEYQITDALKRMVDGGEKVTTFEVDGWYDCGTADTLLESNRHLLSKNATASEQLSSVTLGNVVRPPVFISSNSRITNSIIGPYVTIGDDTVIEGSIIEDSIIGDGAQVRSAFLGHSIVGQYASITGIQKKVNISDHSEISLA